MTRARDRFDTLPREPGRVGAHRGPMRRGRGWLGFVLFVIGLVVVTAVGLFVVDRVVRDSSPTGQGLDYNFPFLPEIVPTPTPTVTPTAPPVVTDPAVVVERGISIMIINATPLAGLQNAVADQLQGAGWPMGTRVSAGSDVLDTVVYYVQPADADIARGLVEAMGVGEARAIAPNVYPGQSVIIVLGKDHPSCLADPVCTPPVVETDAAPDAEPES